MSQATTPLEEPINSEDGLISTHRVKLLVAVVAVAAALSFFAFQAFDSAMVYYYTVGELNEIGYTQDERMVRVSGKLVPDSFHRADGSTLSEFRLTDGAEDLSAAHEGVLPDLFFNDHSEIILEGRYNSDGLFLSENVIVKCPSKYIAQEGDTG